MKCSNQREEAIQYEEMIQTPQQTLISFSSSVKFKKSPLGGLSWQSFHSSNCLEVMTFPILIITRWWMMIFSVVNRHQPIYSIAFTKKKSNKISESEPALWAYYWNVLHCFCFLVKWKKINKQINKNVLGNVCCGCSNWAHDAQLTRL